MSEIILQNCSLDYPLLGSDHRSLKRKLLEFFGQKTNVANNPAECLDSIRGLDNITLNLNKGDRLGVIGLNGAGKSTLLKVLSGIYEPTEGVVQVRGKISSLIGLSVGMQPEASGYENIEIATIIDNQPKENLPHFIRDVEEFTELGRFLSMPVKTYSSGMHVRLAFALATAIHPDILLLDEVVGVGDKDFIHKAKKRMDDVIANSNILVLASHDTSIIEKLCNKVLWLEKGKVKSYGNKEDVLPAYLAS